MAILKDILNAFLVPTGGSFFQHYANRLNSSRFLSFFLFFSFFPFFDVIKYIKRERIEDKISAFFFENLGKFIEDLFYVYNVVTSLHLLFPDTINGDWTVLFRRLKY